MVSSLFASPIAKPPIWNALVLGLVVALLFGDLLRAGPTGRAQERARTGIATETIDILQQRNSNSEILLTVPAGTRLTVTGRARKGFYPVAFAGIEGWALTGSVAINVGERQGHAGRERSLGALRGFATEPLNLRTGPGTSSRVKQVIQAGDDLELTGTERNGFVAVRVGSESGWVAREYVSTRARNPDRAPRNSDRVQPVLRGDPREMTPDDIIPFVYAAADYYGQPREDMLRVAMCESDLVPMAVNEEGGSYGIFQFKTATWLSTPYAEYDIFDPRASAYAAAWMWSVGRRNEWVCQ